MAPNKRGAPQTDTVNGSVITKEEVAARGTGTDEFADSYQKTPLFKAEKRVFFTGLMFLTRLPCPGWCDHHPAYLMRSMQWFPLFGAFIGLWCAIWFEAASVLWPETPLIAVLISTLSGVWLTGCFHEDGLADCFDGFGGGWSKPQILRIMKDSRVGTYALVGVSIVLQLKLQALVMLNDLEESSSGVLKLSGVGAALIAVHAASRWTCVPLIYCCTYIQDEEDAKKGLYNWFAQSQRLLTPIRLFLATFCAVGVPWLVLGPEKAIVIYVVALAVTVMSAYYGNLILGGVIGDYLGATIQVTEACMYLALAADWSGVLNNWQPLAVLAITAALPIIYTRRIIIVPNNAKC